MHEAYGFSHQILSNDEFYHNSLTANTVYGVKFTHNVYLVCILPIHPQKQI